MRTDYKLAVVIPFYKIDFFGDLLEALKNQTCKDFNVYISDDASPVPPDYLITNYKESLEILYHRFDENLGGRNLVAQWQRSLSLINKKEQWVWMLPDDDVPSLNSVESFYEALAKGKSNSKPVKLFRMNMDVINENGKVINDFKDKSPEYETNLQYYLRQLKGETRSSLGDNIFNLEQLNEFGGFVNFKQGWGSDHATILLTSQSGLICFLGKARLGFRMSGKNISSVESDGEVKMSARCDFAKWIKTNEHIFSQKPENQFYRLFYFKGEYYFLNEWIFSLKLLLGLYRLRIICCQSYNIFPILKIAFKKMKLSKK